MLQKCLGNDCWFLEISPKISVVLLITAVVTMSIVNGQDFLNDGPHLTYPEADMPMQPYSLPYFDDFIDRFLPDEPSEYDDMTAAESMRDNNGYDSNVYGRLPNRLHIHGLYDYRSPGFYKGPYAGKYRRKTNYAPPERMNHRPAEYQDRYPSRPYGKRMGNYPVQKNNYPPRKQKKYPCPGCKAQYPKKPYGKPTGRYPLQNHLPITFARHQEPPRSYPNKPVQYKDPGYGKVDYKQPTVGYDPPHRQPKGYEMQQPNYGGSAYAPEFYRLAEQPHDYGPPPGYMHMMDRKRSNDLLLIYLLTRRNG